MARYCRCLVGFGLLVALLLFGGCSRTLSQKTVYPARGRVLLKGEAAAFVIVHLEPADAGQGVSAEAMTQQDGTFELRTYSNQEADGAAPGKYHVILEEYDPVRAVGIQIPPGSKPTKLPFPEWNTGQMVDIESQDNDLPPIALNGDEQGDTQVGAAGR